MRQRFLVTIHIPNIAGLEINVSYILYSLNVLSYVLSYVVSYILGLTSK